MKKIINKILQASISINSIKSFLKNLWMICKGLGKWVLYMGLLVIIPLIFIFIDIAVQHYAPNKYNILKNVLSTLSFSFILIFIACSIMYGFYHLIINIKNHKISYKHISIICIILSITLIYSLYILYKKNNELKTCDALYLNMVSINDKLMIDVNDLETENSELTEKINTYSDELENYEEELGTCQEDYDTLSACINDCASNWNIYDCESCSVMTSLDYLFSDSTNYIPSSSFKLPNQSSTQSNLDKLLNGNY